MVVENGGIALARELKDSLQRGESVELATNKVTFGELKMTQ